MSRPIRLYAGGRDLRRASAVMYRAIETAQRLEKRPIPTRMQRRLVRTRFATMVQGTLLHAPRIRTAIDAARANFWARFGPREADAPGDDDAVLRKYLIAADAMSGAALERALRGAYESMYEQGFEHVRAELNEDFDLRPERALAALDAYGDGFAASVIEDEREALKQLIRTAFEEGVEIPKLAAEIADHFAAGVHRLDDQGDDRVIDLDAWALMVARTETARAQNAGAIDGYMEAGVEQLIWITADDERVCPICNALDGSVANTGENFAGTDAQHGPIHPNCRCGVVGLNELTKSLVRAA